MVKVLEDGEIVTFQAVAQGVHAVDYHDAEAMRDCKVYRWLDSPSQTKIGTYVERNNGRPYDFLGYPWTICGAISMVWFNHPYRLSSWTLFCWENLSEFMRCMGKELQPDDEPCLINKIMTALEGNRLPNFRRPNRRFETQENTA